MGLLNIIRPASQVQNSQGRPLAGGNVYLYEPGTTTFITSYNGSDLVTPLAQPVPLSGSGRANIWITRDVDMFVYDRNGNLVLTELNANPDALGVDQGSGLVPNGSFELDTDANDVPDGWTEVAQSGSSNGIDTTRSTDGANSFRFTSTGVGGGSLTTTDFFPVTDLTDLTVYVDIQGSVLGPNNRVRVQWYDTSFVLISNSDPYNSTATAAGVWTSLQLLVTPPALARFAKLALIGIDPSVPFSGSTWFDRVNVFYPAVVSGVFDNITIQNNEIISTNLNGVIEIKPDGTGELRLGRGAAGFPLYSATAFGGGVTLQKSRNATYGSHTIVQAGDALGSLNFAGSNGTIFVTAADIVGVVDGTPGAGNDMPGRLLFRTVPDGSATLTERMRIDSAGKITISGGAYSAQFTYGGGIPTLAVMAPDSNGVAVSRNSADVNPAFIFLSKSRNTNQGSHTIVQSGDVAGRLDFRGSDGATMQSLGYIEGAVDGTPGVSDMPGRLIFFTTPDGSTTPAERVRIDNAGNVMIGLATAGAGGLGVSTVMNIGFSENSTEALAVLFRQTSSAALWLGMGYKRSANANQVASSWGAALAKAGIGISSIPGGIQFFADSATTVTVGTDLVPTERMRISQNGQIVITKTGVYVVPAQLGGFDPGFAIQGNTVGSGWMSATQFTADTQPAALLFRKSRNATVGSHTIVQSGDNIGAIIAYGSDGAAFQSVGSISFIVDGTPGASDMPGRIAFAVTPDGTAASVEVMRLRQSTIRQALALSPDSGTTFHAVPMVQSLIKSSDTTRTSTTTETDDPTLAGLVLFPSSTYILDSVLEFFSTVDTGDFKWTFDFNGQAGNVTIAGHTIYSSVSVTATPVGSVYVEDANSGNGNLVANVQTILKAKLMLVTNGSYVAGTACDLQWAQRSSDATGTTLRSGSWYMLTKIA
jgi:hypothetical protein